MNCKEPDLKVGINGFGRIGRLILRAAWHWPQITFVKINDSAGDSRTLAHLLQFDSVQGTWREAVSADPKHIFINGQAVACSQEQEIGATDWSDCDVIIDATGVHRSCAKLQKYLEQGVKRVVVTAPVAEDSVLNIVMGVNDHLFDEHPIVTAASCTTNCIAPVVKVIHETLGIERGAITTVHDLTNTQTILDAPHKDLRRARACGMSLIPTTTGSATAITQIFPDLKGRLNGHAIRVPLANASITDMVFEVTKDTSAKAINQSLKQAAETHLKGILGYEERPLVSIDFRGDQRSSIVDALSTMVVGQRMVKIYAWYDNEMGYACRTAELTLKVGQSL